MSEQELRKLLNQHTNKETFSGFTHKDVYDYYGLPIDAVSRMQRDNRRNGGGKL